MAIRIETDRLVLRGWNRADRSALKRMARDPEMMRFVTKGRAMTDAEIKALFKRQRDHLDQHRVCFFAMQLQCSDEVIGLAGMQPLDSGEFEIGWWVWKDHWGHGYASEAARSLIEYARDELQLNSLAAIIDPGNDASINVATKLGLTLHSQIPASDTISTRPDWLINYYRMAL
ncbi:MAG: GNAT family N-acetyltransferase [Pseudomonadota bacterium]